MIDIIEAVFSKAAFLSLIIEDISDITIIKNISPKLFTKLNNIQIHIVESTAQIQIEVHIHSNINDFMPLQIIDNESRNINFGLKRMEELRSSQCIHDPKLIVLIDYFGENLIKPKYLDLICEHLQLFLDKFPIFSELELIEQFSFKRPCDRKRIKLEIENDGATYYNTYHILTKIKSKNITTLRSLKWHCFNMMLKNKNINEKDILINLPNVTLMDFGKERQKDYDLLTKDDLNQIFHSFKGKLDATFKIGFESKVSKHIPEWLNSKPIHRIFNYLEENNILLSLDIPSVFKLSTKTLEYFKNLTSSLSIENWDVENDHTSYMLNIHTFIKLTKFTIHSDLIFGKENLVPFIKFMEILNKAKHLRKLSINFLHKNEYFDLEAKDKEMIANLLPSNLSSLTLCNLPIDPSNIKALAKFKLKNLIYLHYTNTNYANESSDPDLFVPFENLQFLYHHCNQEIVFTYPKNIKLLFVLCKFKRQLVLGSVSDSEFSNSCSFCNCNQIRKQFKHFYLYKVTTNQQNILIFFNDISHFDMLFNNFEMFN